MYRGCCCAAPIAAGQSPPALAVPRNGLRCTVCAWHILCAPAADSCHRFAIGPAGWAQQGKGTCTAANAQLLVAPAHGEAGQGS